MPEKSDERRTAGTRRRKAVEVLKRAAVNESLPQSVRDAASSELERVERMTASQVKRVFAPLRVQRSA